MEHSAANLNSGRTKGFTLVELLVALSLVTVVMALAWIVLESTRRVAQEIESPVGSPLEPLWSQIGDELNRLLPRPVNADIPALRFSEENGLEMVALLPGADRVPLQTELHYRMEESGLIKITRTRFPESAHTNLLSGELRGLRVFARNADREFRDWPPESETPLPPLLTVELTAADGKSESREFFLPASFKEENARKPSDGQ